MNFQCWAVDIFGYVRSNFIGCAIMSIQTNTYMKFRTSIMRQTHKALTHQSKRNSLCSVLKRHSRLNYYQTKFRLLLLILFCNDNLLYYFVCVMVLWHIFSLCVHHAMSFSIIRQQMRMKKKLKHPYILYSLFIFMSCIASYSWYV